jgi:hypothetical protein
LPARAEPARLSTEVREQVEAQIDLLASDAGFRETVRGIGGDNVPITLARLAKDAAVGLLVKGVGDFELERRYSPSTAASILFGGGSFSTTRSTVAGSGCW